MVKTKRVFKNISDHIPIPQNTIRSIEAKSGIRLTDDLRKKLAASLGMYLQKETIDDWPRISERNADLEKISGATEKLLVALGQTSSATKSELTIESDWIKLEELKSELQILKAECDSIITNRKDTGGRPEKFARRVLILELRRLYEKATGKKASVHSVRIDKNSQEFRGPFFNFVNISIDEMVAFAIKDMKALEAAKVSEIFKESNYSIGNAIESALRDAPQKPSTPV